MMSELKLYYSLWDANEKQFSEPIFYDYTFSVRFPNVVLMTSNFEEAKNKIRKINSKISRIDRFELSLSKIQRLVLS